MFNHHSLELNEKSFKSLAKKMNSSHIYNNVNAPQPIQIVSSFFFSFFLQKREENKELFCQKEENFSSSG